MTEDRKELGKRGEDAAVSFLEHKGVEILERNWRCSYGEADIIALDGGTLVFCEVKTRRSSAAGIPEEAITEAKQKRYRRLARVFYNRSETRYSDIRFDVIAIYAFSESQALLRYTRGAFSPLDG